TLQLLRRLYLGYSLGQKSSMPVDSLSFFTASSRSWPWRAQMRDTSEAACLLTGGSSLALWLAVVSQAVSSANRPAAQVMVDRDVLIVLITSGEVSLAYYAPWLLALPRSSVHAPSSRFVEPGRLWCDYCPSHLRVRAPVNKHT